VMVKLFSASLNRSLGTGQIGSGVFDYIRSNEIKLAGMDLPPGLNADTAVLIRASISRAFVFGFRVTMFICTGLSIASSAAAALMIPGKAR